MDFMKCRVNVEAVFSILIVEHRCDILLLNEICGHIMDVFAFVSHYD